MSTLERPERDSRFAAAGRLRRSLSFWPGILTSWVCAGRWPTGLRAAPDQGGGPQTKKPAAAGWEEAGCDLMLLREAVNARPILALVRLDLEAQFFANGAG